MKKRIFSKLTATFMAMAMAVSLIPTGTATVSAGRPVERTLEINPGATSRYAGRARGWDYEAWTDMRQVNAHPVSAQSSRMVLYDDGGFSCEWNNTYNTLFRTGRRWEQASDMPAASTFTSPSGVASMRYDVSNFWSSRGATYMCIYGWTNGTTGNNTEGNAIIEWYIIDGWREWNPGQNSSYRNHGTTVVNGHTYDIISAWRINQPWVGPTNNGTFLQIFNIRRDSRITGETNRSQGTIDVAAHFQSWVNLGIINNPSGSERSAFTNNSRIYEISFTLEGYGGQAEGSRGRGTVDALCLRYTGQTIALCTQGAAGCPNCGGAALPVCGVNGFTCGLSSCTLCTPPPPECTCPASTPTTLYTMTASAAMAATLNIGAESSGGLQRSGEPSFAFVDGGLRISGRSPGENRPWYSADVLLGELELSPNNTYRITATGNGGSAPLQLLFPLDDDPWEFGNVTGTPTSVSMEFKGSRITGQTDYRIRVNTAGAADYTINSVVIEQIVTCCGVCHVSCTCSGGTQTPCGCAERLPASVYKSAFSDSTGTTLTAGEERDGILQRSGENAQPTFASTAASVQVSNRGANWHGLDVVLGELNLNPQFRYRMSVTGTATSALRLSFPLDAEPWEAGGVTGTTTTVSLEFDGATVSGQGEHRIRVNTGDTSNFTITGITIELIRCCAGFCTDCTCPKVCGDCDYLETNCDCGFSQVLPPLNRLNVIEACGCGQEMSVRTTQFLCVDTGAVLETRKGSKRDKNGLLLKPCTALSATS